ncbi:MAG: complex I NDUFA9 subunit family protein, partial [Burkholderiales bacterium]|nr:complex I NDUFA9 subunit family protein [Burkholderiales bacterium]
RRLGHGAALRPLPSLELVEADIHDDAQLAHLVAGADAVIQLVAILHGSAADFRRVHVELPTRVARACVAAGTRRLIHVSALGAAADAPSNYLRSKAEGEAALKAAGLDLTLLRPSVIFGVEDHFLNLFARPQAVTPLVPLAGAAARFQPVWVEDVASATVRCLDDDRSIGATYELAGPSTYSLADLVRLAGRWSGHERPVLPLPGWAGRLQALAFECLPGQPLMSRDNLESMRVPNVAGGQLPGFEALGITPAALEAVVPSYLGGEAGCGRLERWRAERA